LFDLDVAKKLKIAKSTLDGLELIEKYIENGKSKKLTFSSKDGTKLVGILETSHESTDACVILCHGFRSGKDDCGHLVRAAKIISNGYAVFRFDFRAHGESEGIDYEMTIEKEVEDLTAAVELVESKGYKNIILLGSSFGGGVASVYTVRNESKIKKLILWYALIDYDIFFSSGSFGEKIREEAFKNGYAEIVSKTTGKIFRLGKCVFEEAAKLNIGKDLRKLNIPILFVHGTNDESVTYESSEKHSKFCKNARLETIVNGKHGFRDSEEGLNQAIKATVEFIRK